MLVLRKLVNALPCVLSGVTARGIAELGWRAHLDVGLAGKHKGWLASEAVVHLAAPLVLGHGYSMWTDFMVVDCLVLLFVGGLLFPLLAPPADTKRILGPLSVKLVRA